MGKMKALWIKHVKENPEMYDDHMEYNGHIEADETYYDHCKKNKIRIRAYKRSNNVKRKRK